MRACRPRSVYLLSSVSDDLGTGQSPQGIAAIDFH